MIIRGIIDRSLDTVTCIRGFAKFQDLVNISEPKEYQRDLDKEHKKEIEGFYKQAEFLFFPEVILSYKTNSDHDNITLKASTNIDIYKVENNTKIKFSKKRIDYKGTSDIREKESIELITIEIDDNFITDKKLFSRIDGNHRLKAGEKMPPYFGDYNTPFCIILLNDDSADLAFESVIFHNINTKAKNLTSEENLKVLLRSESFDDEQLRTKFGWEYYAVRQIFNQLPLQQISEVYPNLGADFLSQPMSFTKNVVDLLVENKIINKNRAGVESINGALSIVNQEFSKYPVLREMNGIAVTVAAIYLQISSFSIDSFLQWVKKNHIYVIDDLKSKSLIDIYKKIQDAKKKEVFVSMQFSDDTQRHYEAIVKAVKEVNEFYTQKIEIKPIRIDKNHRGYSYDINTEILNLIEDSGLFIADISIANPNVYHEIGYLMGLNQGKKLPHENFILIKSDEDKFKNNKVGFNITSIQQLRFSNDLELVMKLKEQIAIFYDLK
ncbi:hypothetical protein [Dysgonomonas sp. ZJ709]|uniref:hypothetical protein n=1 Tax=Dysgonomonas sp. ZJ709 TaxID=2709797 RepID=UPI0013EBAFB6|nr:hypothetical protein [Dysgonomonas sp. ZJ709]